jgi:hypothetical protein
MVLRVLVGLMHTLCLCHVYFPSLLIKFYPIRPCLVIIVATGLARILKWPPLLDSGFVDLIVGGVGGMNPSVRNNNGAPKGIEEACSKILSHGNSNYNKT